MTYQAAAASSSSFSTCVSFVCMSFEYNLGSHPFFKKFSFYFLFFIFGDLSTICHLRLYRPVVHISRSSIGTSIYVCLNIGDMFLYSLETAALIWNRPRVWNCPALGDHIPSAFFKTKIKLKKKKKKKFFFFIFFMGNIARLKVVSPHFPLCLLQRKNSATYRD